MSLAPPPATEAGLPADGGLRALLAERAFVRFWCARVAGTSGNQMMMVAIGWQMYELTGSAWDLGLVGLLQFLPSVVLMLVAGHLADRHHRGRILAAALTVQTGISAVLMLGSAGGWAGRETLLGLSLLIGAAKAFQMPVQQSLLPLLVPAAKLPRAIALSSAGMQTAIIGGPAIGGFVYVAGPEAVYGVCGLLFLVGVVLTLGLRYVQPPVPKEPVNLKTVFAGLAFIRSRPAVLGAISMDLFAVLLGGATALLPIFAKDILHVGPWGLGLLRAAPAVGALALSVWLSRRPIERQVGPKMFRAVAVYGLATLVFGLSTSFWLSLAALFVAGAADMVSVVIRQSLVQLETPDAMRGRVSAVNGIFIGASNQLGEFESGATAAVLGPVGSVLLGGFGTLAVVAIWRRRFPALARRDRMTEGSTSG